MIYPSWIEQVSHADFVQSAGLYVTRDRLFFVRLRKDFSRVSLVEAEMREVALREDDAKVSSLTGWISEEVGATARSGEIALNRQALHEALRSLLSHFDSAKDPFYLCLGQDRAIVCEVALPEVARENLPQVVAYEIERLIPFRREEIYYDYLPLGRKGDKLVLLLFAVPKRVLDELLETLAAFGIRPKAVETTATALVNYLLFCTGGLEGPALILGGGEQNYEMIGLSGGVKRWRKEAGIIFARCLPQAGWSEGSVQELLHGSLQDSPRLFSWGDVQNYSITLGGQLPEPTSLLALAKGKLGGNKGLDQSSFIPAVGVALRGVRENALSVSLLAGTAGQNEDRPLSWINMVLTVVLLIGLLVWAASYPVKDEIRVRQLRRQIDQLEPSVAALRREEDELSRLRKDISFLSSIGAHKGEVLGVMDELSRIVPKSVYLSSLRYRDGTLELQGNADNASALVPLLERSPVFENVGFNAPSNRGRDNRETFSLKAELEQPKTTKAGKP